MSPTTKLFVLDTNVLIHDPHALFKFDEHSILLPMTVIEEIDGLKKGMDEKGANAREVTRTLDALRKKAPLQQGAPLPGGGLVFVTASFDLFGTCPELNPAIADDRILATAANAHRKMTGTAYSEVILVSKDANVRIKADALGLHAEDFENDKVDRTVLYETAVTLPTDPEVVDQVHAARTKGIECPTSWAPELVPNQCLTLQAFGDPSKTALVRYTGTGRLVRVNPKISVMDLVPRNREQAFALDLLTDPSIALVTLVGKAGTGKTLLAIAAGLAGVEDGIYRRVSVARPVVPLGRQEIGFLPGDEGEKLAPWMLPIYDNIEVLVDGGSRSPKSKSGRYGTKEKFQARIHPAEELKQMGLLEVSGLYNIRGRSLPHTFMIIDEAQNLTPHEVKTIITRAGEGTKVVLTGDPDQIDNPYVDSLSNGLTYAAERFKSTLIAGHLTLLKGERSELAEVASRIL